MTVAVHFSALMVDTFREAMARKIFWGFWGCSTVLLLGLLTVLGIDIVEGSVAAVRIFGQDLSGNGVSAEQMVDGVLGGLAAFLFSMGLFLAIFASAGLIPPIFEPGRIEMLLSKPLSRSRLLLGKYLGALAVIGANIAYLVIGAWLILGFKTGIWKAGFLYAGLLAVFAFAVMLTVVTLIGTAFQSSVLATMGAYLVMVVGSIAAHHERIAPLLNSEFSRNLVRATYWSLPKVFEIGDLSRRMMAGEAVTSWAPFWTSGLFAAVVLSLSLWIFERKDY